MGCRQAHSTGSASTRLAMKLTAPKTAEEYFQRTEHAVKHAYAGLASCWSYVEEAEKNARPPVIKDGMAHYLPPQTPEEEAQLERSLAAYRKYFELKISEAMFAGSILDAAYMAIKLYSRNTSIPASCASFVKPSQPTVPPFCIGADRHGIPQGLLFMPGGTNTRIGGTMRPMTSRVPSLPL